MAVIYILLCANNEYYVGCTSDLERRLQDHQTGRGADFTKGHLPFKLVYTEEYLTLEEAYKRERQLHGWSRERGDGYLFHE